MKYNVVISNKANQLIKRQLAFLANVSKSAAEKQGAEFIRRIGENPRIFPAFEGFQDIHYYFSNQRRYNLYRLCNRHSQ